MAECVACAGVPEQVPRAAAPEHAGAVLSRGAFAFRLWSCVITLTHTVQGTRSASGKMAEFKKGAFTVAAKEGAAVVPITLDGTGRLMRNGACFFVSASNGKALLG